MLERDAQGLAAAQGFSTLKRSGTATREALGARGTLAQATLLAALVCGACHAGDSQFPWANGGALPASHREVRTLNVDYERTRSSVLVRQITRPTRANLDYAAYHANFMLATPAPESLSPSSAQPSSAQPFAGALERATLTGDLRKTPLSPAEREQPLAFAPLVEFLQAKKLAGSAELASVGSGVREEAWGLPRVPGVPTQAIAEVYLHAAGAQATELWAKVEFEPWFQGSKELSDADGDGYPEVYGRVASKGLPQALVTAIREDYAGRVLSPAEVKTWGNQLASYWYPTFNTDLVTPGEAFPDAETEAQIRRELGTRSFRKPTLVVRGKPEGKATYAVFLVEGNADCDTEDGCASAASKSVFAQLELGKTRASPAPKALRERIERELEEHGGSWEAWARELRPLATVVRQRLRSTPKRTKALAGENGFLFFRGSLEYALGGDLEKQAKGKNPLPAIVEFKRMLEAEGVDFLFVPVPTKLEIYPEEFDAELAPFSGKVVNPYARKFAWSLSRAGVEVIDLAPAFLEEKARTAEAGKEPLFQRQDTHWSARGLRRAADVIAARVRKYPWYTELSPQRQKFVEKAVSFQRFGDLHSRLAENLKRKYRPEPLVAQQVIDARGALYEDDAESPLVLLGDSFTAAYQLTDAQHAGISAQLAKQLGIPLDLVMSYGGGPNVRSKLMRRGSAALGRKKLVIWLMTARDLYRYWEAWEPLAGAKGGAPADEPDGAAASER